MKIIRKKKGITLIETIIATAIFAMIMIPISTVIVTAVKNNKEGENKQQALNYGQKLMEEIKALDDETFLNLSTPSKNPIGDITITEDGDSYKINGNGEGYGINGTITPLDQYKFHSDETAYKAMPKDLVITLDNNKISMKEKDSEIKEKIIEENKLIFQVKEDNIEITDKSKNTIFNISGNNKALALVFSKTSKGEYELNIINEKKDFALYIAKERNSESKYNLTVEKDPFDLYEGIIQDSMIKDSAGKVYDIKITLKKNGISYNMEEYKKIRQ